MAHDPTHKPDLISREAAALACYAVIPPLSPWDEAHRHAINLHHVYSRIGATPAEAWRRQIETNGGPLDAGEVATRIQKWMDRGYRLVNVSVKILGGEALSSTPVAATPAPVTVKQNDGHTLTGIWPDFIAPSKYENPDPRWKDPGLPDFRLIWKLAREAGYSVGLHGSMKRDCDLIAAPWTEEAVSAESLIDHLCTGLNAFKLGKQDPEPVQKPHGRLAWCIQIRDAYKKHIDISVMPVAALSPATPALSAAMRLPEIKRLVKMAKWLGIAAQTTGGTAGRDIGLIAAIELLAEALAALPDAEGRG